MKSIKISTLLSAFLEQHHHNENLLSPLMCNKKCVLFFSFRGHFVVLFVGFFVAVGLFF